MVRRSSGGGPVLWDAGLLALDVALPRGHPLAGDDVVDAYRWLGEAIAEALRALGVPDVEVVSIARAREDRARPGPAADACFGGLSPFEVPPRGARWWASPRRAGAPGALLQAGILMSLDPGLLARLLGRDEEFAAGLAAAAAGLDELAPGLTAGGRGRRGRCRAGAPRGRDDLGWRRWSPVRIRGAPGARSSGAAPSGAAAWWRASSSPRSPSWPRWRS